MYVLYIIAKNKTSGVMAGDVVATYNFNNVICVEDRDNTIIVRTMDGSRILYDGGAFKPEIAKI